MRQIKFRAWHYITRKMMPKLDLYSTGQIVEFTEESGIREVMHLGTFDLMQLTGFKDKNRKDIYEGDVVKHHNSEVGNLEVKFWQGQWIGMAFDAAFQPLYNEEWSVGRNCQSDLEVIGNIYENPELLEPAPRQLPE